jgi:hypothetical protein
MTYDIKSVLSAWALIVLNFFPLAACDAQAGPFSRLGNWLL